MKISFTGAPEYMDRHVGYGEASFHIFEQFKKNNVECVIKDKTANIGISFIQPDQFTFGKDQYKIGYTPWESTGIPWSWENPINNVVDELWTTSQWCADIFKKYTDKPIFIYEHGVQESWTPVKRTKPKNRPFRFLHIGEPAYRKDAQAVVNAFTEIFGDDPNYELVLKCSRMSTVKIFDKETGEVKGSPSAIYDNIKMIEGFLTVSQMNALYDMCDVFVYPSWGEGFGFNPLQAMAKAIPTICTSGWATYAEYITAPLQSKLNVSPWQEIHPGDMLKPNYNQLKNYMIDITKDYESYADIAYTNSFLVHKRYAWDEVTAPAIKRLKEIEKSYFKA